MELFHALTWQTLCEIHLYFKAMTYTKCFGPVKQTLSLAHSHKTKLYLLQLQSMADCALLIVRKQ